MARCNHDPISLTIQCTRLIVATVAETGAIHVARNAPDLAPLHIDAHCLACGYTKVLTSFNSPTPAWKNWPAWLARRLQYLRRYSDDLDEALTSIGVIDLGYGLPLLGESVEVVNDANL